jgi:hypothetical protein
MASIEVFSALSKDGTRALIQFEEDGKTITEKIMGPEELGIFITQLGRLPCGPGTRCFTGILHGPSP